MKLYLVQEKNQAQKHIGLALDVFSIKGIYKNKERAVAANAKLWGINTVITEIDTDLFDKHTPDQVV